MKRTNVIVYAEYKFIILRIYIYIFLISYHILYGSMFYCLSGHINLGYDKINTYRSAIHYLLCLSLSMEIEWFLLSAFTPVRQPKAAWIVLMNDSSNLEYIQNSLQNNLFQASFIYSTNFPPLTWMPLDKAFCPQLSLSRPRCSKWVPSRNLFLQCS